MKVFHGLFVVILDVIDVTVVLLLYFIFEGGLVVLLDEVTNLSKYFIICLFVVTYFVDVFDDSLLDEGLSVGTHDGIIITYVVVV